MKPFVILWRTVCLFLAISRRVMCLRKFETVGMVPKSFFEEQRCIFCFVERVIDGDTIRVRHIPGYSWLPWKRRPAPLEKRGISDETLSIRIYGVDCPELSKRKDQEPQPYALEAKQFTIDFCLHQTVKITLLRKDQYGRAIAVVEKLPPAGPLFKWIKGLGRTDLTVALAKNGLAELYTSGGAEYWNKRDLLESKIVQAQQRKLGMWSQGTSRVSAAEHKRILREQGQPKEAPSSYTFSAAQTFRNLTNCPEVAHGVRGGHSGKGAKGNDKDGQTKKKSTMLEAAVTGLEMLG